MSHSPDPISCADFCRRAYALIEVRHEEKAIPLLLRAITASPADPYPRFSWARR